MIATRDAYGEVLLEIGEKRPEVVVLDADLWNSTRTQAFRDRFPDRFFDMGICEQNMVGVAAGLATCGKIPFASSFACFISRAWEHTRVTVASTGLPVKLVTTHAGISVGEDGHSAQMCEDLAIYRVLPNMTVIVPADAVATRQAVWAAVDIPGPVFMRLGRPKVPVIYGPDYKFEVGKATWLREGTDVALIGCGIMVSACLEAADWLASEGLSATVLDVATIKPLDEEAIVQAAGVGAVVTAEEHQVAGGLGSAVAEVLSQHRPTWIEGVGVQNTFGESGPPAALLEKYGLTAKHVYEAAKRAIARRDGREASL